MNRELFENTYEHPGEALKRKLAERGWTQEEFALITGKSKRAISDIARGTAGITAEMAMAFSAALGDTPEEWLRIDALYKLSKTESGFAPEIQKMAKLYALAPIRDMQRRGWIRQENQPESLESELMRFFDCKSLDMENLNFHGMMRRNAKLSPLTPSELAWCYRARYLAKGLAVVPFNENKCEVIGLKLRKLAAYPKEARHIARLFMEYGIKFIVIEPIPNVRIDGAAFWIDEAPVIAMTIRHDRIDGFWFTLMHEFAHIRNRHGSVDVDIIDGVKGINIPKTEDEAERIANEQAAASLIPSTEIQSFIRRVGPFYARERIIQFAHKIKIHPGIIVGQLHHRNEIGYSALREMLVKIRDIVTSTALTDGWNQTITPETL
jgi:HTH-type transcriptional regulator/antitoxin HigA